MVGYSYFLEEPNVSHCFLSIMRIKFLTFTMHVKIVKPYAMPTTCHYVYNGFCKAACCFTIIAFNLTIPPSLITDLLMSHVHCDYFCLANCKKKTIQR